MKSIKTLIIMIALMALMVSCDEHKDFPDTGIKVGMVLLSDGRIVALEEYKPDREEAVGVIFRLNKTSEEQGTAFAVSLKDLPAASYATSLEEGPLGTSTDITAFTGNADTYAMYTSGKSPIATSLIDIWRYGQSAYLPSVAQMTALIQVKDKINHTLAALNGDLFTDSPDEAWYWTSNEVAGQSAHKAWLISTVSGAIHETPKDEVHKARPMITVYY